MRKNVNMLYGAVAGDIIGSAYERYPVKTKDFCLFSSRSDYTDDTVMTIASADALLNDRNYKKTYLKWGNLYPHAGYGGSFRRWLASADPQPYRSWGNGSAMRISPVGLAGNDIRWVLDEAERSASVTHDHPEGIKGAQAVALAVFLAKNGSSKEDIRNEISSRFRYDLSGKLDQLRPEYRFDVSCMGSVPAALLAFLESADYEDAVRNAVSLGGDSDTLAAITGSIAIAFYREMPENIAGMIEKTITPEMSEICRLFHEKFSV